VNKKKRKGKERKGKKRKEKEGKGVGVGVGDMAEILKKKVLMRSYIYIFFNVLI